MKMGVGCQGWKLGSEMVRGPAAHLCDDPFPLEALRLRWGLHRRADVTGTEGPPLFFTLFFES